MEKFTLNGIWKVTSDTYNTSGEVPGSVYSILLANGLMEDPFYRDNEKKTTGITDEEFTFSKEFNYKKPSNSVLLVCEGLDTLCDIYINGKFVSRADNMHRTYYFEVAPYLVDGNNQIKVVFPPYDAYIKAKNKESYVSNGSIATMEGFAQLRKAFYMSGWDWGPMLPDAGIWRDIYLIDGNTPRITDVRILQRHEEGKVFVCVKANTSLPADVRAKIVAPNGEATVLENGKEAEIKNPELWWPNGYGAQPLYSVICESVVNGEVVDVNTKKIGLRTLYISREKDEWGEEFCYKINGIKIFAMGADYVPEDNILSRITRERSNKLLDDCLFANFNSIRIWGGGFYPSDDFFELCDEKGIILFFDMMFACTALPTDQAFHENVKQEVIDNLRRFRHHACIAVISGNNEMEIQAASSPWWTKEEKEGYLKLFEEMIPAVIEEECPEISYVPSSPSTYGGFNDPQNETIGDVHYWSVWFEDLPFTEYRNHYFRFLSEYGFQSFPSIKTIEEFTLPEDRNPLSLVMELHQRSSAANGKILYYLSQTYLYPMSMETMVFASQLLQAEAMKCAVEHMRRNRGRCMGSLYWQLNDCWPVASWASIDSNGRYKALHYEAKRFYEPIHISCAEVGEYPSRRDITQERCYGYETKAQIFVNNDTLQDVVGTIEWALCKNDGTIFEKGSQEVCVKALSYTSIDEMDFHKTDIRNNYLTFSFKVDGKVISSGSVLFTRPKHFNFLNPKIKLEVKGDEITVTADAFARYVYISNDNDDLRLSDNFFDLDKGSKTVKILSDDATNLKVKSVYDIR